MSRYIAIETFLDESDGTLVVAGETSVDPSATLFKRYPSCFKVQRGYPFGGLFRREGGPTGIRRGKVVAHDLERPRWFLGKDNDEAWRL